MPPLNRAALVPVLQSFAAAATELQDEDAWSLGWTTEPA